MDNLSVIDRFTETFARYIDSGFGLLQPEAAYLSATLIAIDITLAGLFWALGGADDVLGRLVKKVLYVGAFAYIIGNFKDLANIVFRSFAKLGLTASGSGLTEGQLLQPGRVAAVGVDAGRPILKAIGDLAGFPSVFANIDTITVLFIAWVVVIVSFFVLAVQLFITLLEFKLTTLAGFILVPFALWNRTAFLAEKVLGNVVASGVKVLVLAVVVGIGSTLFSEFRSGSGASPTIDQALSLVLASVAMLGLGIFGPSIATGLVSGAPQLGAGAAVGAAAGATGVIVAGGAATLAAGRLAGGAASGSLRAATSLGAGAREAYGAAAAASGNSGLAGVGAGLAGVARPGGQATVEAVGSAARRVLQGPTGQAGGAERGSDAPDDGPPRWARRMKQAETVRHGVSSAARAVSAGHSGGSGPSPRLAQEET